MVREPRPNIQLLHYINSLCTRSHCAAHIEPLELLEHEDVVVLSDTASPDSAATFHIHDMLRTRSAPSY